jgi:hypothetical protein
MLRPIPAGGVPRSGRLVASVSRPDTQRFIPFRRGAGTLARGILPKPRRDAPRGRQECLPPPHIPPAGFVAKIPRMKHGHICRREFPSRFLDLSRTWRATGATSGLPCAGQ